jgi:hypothetical protein
VYVANQAKALLGTLTKNNGNIGKQAGISHLVNYYVSALESQPLGQRKDYLAPMGQIIALRKASDTKKLFGSLMALPLSDTSNMFEKYAFFDSRKSLSSDYLYLSNYLAKYKASLTPTFSNRYAKLFSKGVSQAENEDASLYAAQQGMKSIVIASDLQLVKAAVSGRFNQINF